MYICQAAGVGGDIEYWKVRSEDEDKEVDIPVGRTECGF